MVLGGFGWFRVLVTTLFRKGEFGVGSYLLYLTVQFLYFHMKFKLII